MSQSKQFYAQQLVRSTIALVLAGGRGSRLMQMTDWRAKPAVPFGCKFRIIDFTLSNCINSGIRKIGVITQYKADSLIRHIQQGWGFLRGEFGEYVDLMPAQQRMNDSSWYKGTADAVLQNMDIVRAQGPKHILILAGDHIYSMNYATMLVDHVDQTAELTIGTLEVPITEAHAFGIIEVGPDRRITAFMEKPQNPPNIPEKPDKAMASMGIYIFNAEFLWEQLQKFAKDPECTHDFGRDFIPGLIDRYKVNAYPFKNIQNGQQCYWRDVGTIDSYWAANMELVKIEPDLNLYNPNWPIWTHQEQNPPAKFVFDDDNRRGEAIDSMISGGCIISGARIKRSLICSNVRVNSYSTVQDSIILPNVNVGSHCRINKAIVEEGCIIPSGTLIGVNPEADKERFHVSQGGVILITPDMLAKISSISPTDRAMADADHSLDRAQTTSLEPA